MFSEKAVSKVYFAKGRPSDNPLIVHVCDLSMLEKLVTDFNSKAKVLAENFWPGPLTMILPKNNLISNLVSGNLNTVAIRIPNHEITLEVIKQSNLPLAAPSANISGSPSPTKVKHVLNDLEGKIDGILDGGDCEIGLESTVVDVSNLNNIKILRPGAITKDMLKEVLKTEIKIDKSVYHKIDENKKVSSPGMKYKHYAPKCKEIFLVKADKIKYTNYVNNVKKESLYAFCYDEDISLLKVPYISYGSRNNIKKQMKNLFDRLRYVEKIKINHLYIHIEFDDNAVYNRLLRASGFNVIKL
ncbi:MAG: threonylcarbamoyl-AMP synthase [Candidatus Paraimprobicoccus trichonymphae]|uniref:Threonylcarbamoyl-AMP synthase n=1 Tax=Candidatus Paraimprobicoccus trichonymphae TaxID=3033793 RepID=A0AA48KY44_9FIRM|nr:MAG: threonylcarbamoyl-AMP synthase [Candidatus Paraimprobicoccus trichonymphae]